MKPSAALMQALPSHSSELFLTYPLSWHARENPNSAETEARALGWLEARGVIADERGRQTFRKLSVGSYGGCPFPFARDREAEVITRFLSLWIFYDDLLEESSDCAEESLEELLSGRLESAPSVSVHMACWWELGRATAEKMSPSWAARHARRFSDWARSVRPENLVATTFREQGVLPSHREHLARRSTNIGVLPTLDFLEYQAGWELPDEVQENDDFRAILRATSELIAIVNDLFGFTKDYEGKWCNLVSCIAHEYQLSLEDAFRHAVRMHDQRVATILRHEQRVRRAFAASRELQVWFEDLHYLCAGFARWHASAPRYRATHVLDSGRSVQLSVRCVSWTSERLSRHKRRPPHVVAHVSALPSAAGSNCCPCE